MAVGGEGVPVFALVRALEDGDARVRGLAALALGSALAGTADPPPALTETRETDRETRVRARAELSLCMIDGEREPSVDLLAALFGEEGLWRPVGYLHGVTTEPWGRGVLSAQSTRPLDYNYVELMMVFDDAHWARKKAAEILGGMGPQGAQAVRVLAGLLTSEYGAARADAAMALGAIGPWAADAASALGQALRNERSRWGSYEMAEAISKMGPAAAPAVPALVEALDIDDWFWFVRRNAILALGAIGPAASDAIPALERLRDSGDEYAGVRRAAARAIKRIGAR
jgi:hypothetical protein